MIEALRRRAAAPIDGASSFVLRVALGLLLVVGVIRQFAFGWVDSFYVAPRFHFTYWGFSFIRAWAEPWMSLHLVALGLAALALAVGFRHRLAAVTAFLLFTYFELIDESTYLNHYYLVSIVLALMAFMPLSRGWSVDARGRGEEQIPRLCLWVLRLQFGLVYFFAGVAKLKADWLFEAQPLSIWLSANADAPLVGPLLREPWVAFFASWFGAIFDLTLPFALLWKRTRPYAFVAALLFHLVTAYLFKLGMFPWIMMAGATLFFEPDWPRRALRLGERLPRPRPDLTTIPGWMWLGLGAHFLVQLALPLRHHLYAGNMCWTEQGFRFAWHVMLVEKGGLVRYRVHDAASNREWLVYPRDYLAPHQQKAMATQPDMILQLAHHIARDYTTRLGAPVEVRADAFVAFNGRRSQRLIDPDVDLTTVEDGLAPKPWILPLRSEL